MHKLDKKRVMINMAQCLVMVMVSVKSVRMRLVISMVPCLVVVMDCRKLTPFLSSLKFSKVADGIPAKQHSEDLKTPPMISKLFSMALINSQTSTFLMMICFFGLMQDRKAETCLKS